MVCSLVLGAFKVMNRIVKQRVFSFDTTVGIVEARDAHGLLPWVL